MNSNVARQILQDLRARISDAVWLAEEQLRRTLTDKEYDDYVIMEREE